MGKKSLIHDGGQSNRKRRVMSDTKRMSKGYFKFNSANSK